MDLPDSQGMFLSEAARWWPCGKMTLRKWIDEGKVPAFRVGVKLAMTVGELKRARALMSNDPSALLLPIDEAIKQAENNI